MRAHSVDIENRVVESIYIEIYPGIGDLQDEMFKLSMNITWSVFFSNITLLYRLGITFRYIIWPDKHDGRELFTKTSKFLFCLWWYWWIGVKMIFLMAENIATTQKQKILVNFLQVWNFPDSDFSSLTTPDQLRVTQDFWNCDWGTSITR